jgi:hypothetical protein
MYQERGNQDEIKKKSRRNQDEIKTKSRRNQEEIKTKSRRNQDEIKTKSRRNQDSRRNTTPPLTRPSDHAVRPFPRPQLKHFQHVGQRGFDVPLAGADGVGGLVHWRIHVVVPEHQIEKKSSVSLDRPCIYTSNKKIKDQNARITSTPKVIRACIFII